MIKNYTSKANSFEKIQKVLAAHKATHLMFDYGQDGRVTGLSFSIMVDGKEVGFRLPAKVENVSKIMYGTSYLKLNEKHSLQAYQTTWANIRDWIDAQMAMVDTEQVKIEEVFLPYGITKDGRTFFEYHRDNQFLLSEGKEEDK
jgi:hypothetical protein